MHATITQSDTRRPVVRRDDPFDRLIQDFWNRNQDSHSPRDLIAPAIDIAEDAEAITLHAELPGVERKDLEVQVKDGVLTLRGEKRSMEEKQDRHFHRIERRYGSFYRAISLPDTVDPDRVEATFRNGLLQVRLLKRADRQPRTIEVTE